MNSTAIEQYKSVISKMSDDQIQAEIKGIRKLLHELEAPQSHSFYEAADVLLKAAEEEGRKRVVHNDHGSDGDDLRGSGSD